MIKRKKDDIDFEIKFYEGVLKEKGDFLQALIALGDLYTKKGLYKKGLAIDLKLSRLRPEDPCILYNLACSYSLLEDLDRALQVMKMAIQSGYHDFQFLETDPDLTNLRKDQRFKRYLTKTKAQLRKKHS